jgi:hypothetical protein
MYFARFEIAAIVPTWIRGQLSLVLALMVEYQWLCHQFEKKCKTLRLD